MSVCGVSRELQQLYREMESSVLPTNIAIVFRTEGVDVSGRKVIIPFKPSSLTLNYHMWSVIGAPQLKDLVLILKCDCGYPLLFLFLSFFHFF